MFIDKIIVNIKLDGKELKSFPQRCVGRQGQSLYRTEEALVRAVKERNVSPLNVKGESPNSPVCESCMIPNCFTSYVSLLS